MTGSLVARVAQWTRDQRLATPVHLFCQRAVTDALERLRVGLDARISYAVKANTHPLMLRAVADVDEYNVTNTEHLQLLLSARVAPSRIAFVNPAIDRATAETALRAGVTRFVVDDERGLELLTSFGTGLRLTLRLRPAPAGPPRTIVAAFADLIAAGQAVAQITRRGLTPSMLELLDRACLQAVEEWKRLGIEADVKGTQNVIIAAADTVMNRPSRDVLAEVFPGTTMTREIGEFGSLLAIDHARRVLGYEPRHSWRDRITP